MGYGKPVGKHTYCHWFQLETFVLARVTIIMVPWIGLVQGVVKVQSLGIHLQSKAIMDHRRRGRVADESGLLACRSQHRPGYVHLA